MAGNVLQVIEQFVRFCQLLSKPENFVMGQEAEGEHRIAKHKIRTLELPPERSNFQGIQTRIRQNTLQYVRSRSQVEVELHPPQNFNLLATYDRERLPPHIYLPKPKARGAKRLAAGSAGRCRERSLPKLPPN